VDQILESPASAMKLHSYSVHNGRMEEGDPDIDSELQPLLQMEEDEIQRKSVSRAITINFLANVFLLVAKLIVALKTNSLSVTASLVDSILDFLSTVIIYGVTKLIAHRNEKTTYVFPVGKNRLEPIGVLVFAVVMIVSFIQVCAEAFSRLLHHVDGEPVVHLSLLAVITMASTVVVKGLCWIGCRASKNTGVKALATDALNDVVFNIASIAFPLAGESLLLWWLDPLGAILISLYIIVEWLKTATGHVQNLTGMSADLLVVKTILYLSARFSDKILFVSAISAYHAGDNLLVEVDIVLDENMSLRDVHDLSESLQFTIESLPKVERAFVHSDYSASNLPGHRNIYAG
jgi:cation diffusion facilitator family transporter